MVAVPLFCTLKVMSQGTIRNDVFLQNTALQCWNNAVVTIRNHVVTMLQRCVALEIVVANRLACNITLILSP